MDFVQIKKFGTKITLTKNKKNNICNNKGCF